MNPDVINITQSINFTEKEQTVEWQNQIKEDFYSEIRSFSNYLLSISRELQIIIKSVSTNTNLQVKYQYIFSSQSSDDLNYFISTFQYLPFQQLKNNPKEEEQKVNKVIDCLDIKKKVCFLPVGKINNSPIEPPIMPLLNQERDNGRFQIPLVKAVDRLDINYHWKNTLKLLSQIKGTLVIKIKPFIPESFDSIYALHCLNLYSKTYENKITQKEFLANTRIFRSLIEKEQIFQVQIFTHSENNQLLKLAFLQDLDINSFEWSLNTPSYQQHPQFSKARPEIQAFIHKLPNLWVQDEITKCLVTPPYSFGDPLSGMKQFIPVPFNIPVQEQLGDLLLGHISKSDEKVYLDRELLRRHLFVTGSNGSGKSNTVHHILNQLLDVPLLIIDPIKTEYEEIMRARGHGDEKIINFRKGNIPEFNPFIPAPNIPIYDHVTIISRVFAILCPTNNVALDLIQNMVKVTYWRKIYYAVYYGEISFPENADGDEFNLDNFLSLDGQFLRDNPTCIPTFDDYLHESMDWLKDRNRQQTEEGEEEQQTVYYTEWERETINYFEQRHQNLELSLFSKIMRGNEPVDRYFESDYLIELGNISEPNEKNALFALFTLLLYEYRRSEGIQEHLKHITILEEAHRIIPSQTKQLDKDSSTSPEHEAATLVANMLAEIRAFGEGIIVVDQSPSKILSDALINCNTKIIHQIGYGEDKKTLAQALSLSKEQQNFLSSLQIGKAITIHPEITQPIYVSIPKA